MNEENLTSSVTVRISNVEWQTLNDVCKDMDLLLGYFNSVIPFYSSMLVNLPNNKINNVINFLGDLLVKIGFNEEYKLNKKGQIIESVIEKFTNTFIKNPSTKTFEK